MQTIYDHERLAKIRKARGMTQEDLARASGLSRVSIARYETGKCEMSIRSAQKIVTALGCSFEDIIAVAGTN